MYVIDDKTKVETNHKDYSTSRTKQSRITDIMLIVAPTPGATGNTSISCDQNKNQNS